MSTNDLLYNRQYIYGPQPDPATPGEPEHEEEEKEERAETDTRMLYKRLEKLLL